MTLLQQQDIAFCFYICLGICNQLIVTHTSAAMHFNNTYYCGLLLTAQFHTSIKIGYKEHTHPQALSQTVELVKKVGCWATFAAQT